VIKFLLNIVVGFALSMILAPIVMYVIKKFKAKQNILEYVENHSSKQGTLTMGGLIFLIGSLISYFIFFNTKYNVIATLCLFSFLGYGLLGFLDDFLKIKFKHNEGLKAYQKFIGQVGIAVILSVFIYKSNIVGSEIYIPFMYKTINIGWWVIPFVILFYVAVTNAVNLTDGLDGLAGGISFVVLFVVSIIISLIIDSISNLGEGFLLVSEYTNLIVFLGGVVGSLLAYLVFNSYPAKIFMGDTGSLALGGLIASVFALTRLYLLLLIIGIMFVLTTLSVIIQVIYFKITKKRVFLMAPLHHHFQLKGCNENKIVTIYIIVSIIVGIFSIAMYMI